MVQNVLVDVGPPGGGYTTFGERHVSCRWCLEEYFGPNGRNKNYPRWDCATVDNESGFR